MARVHLIHGFNVSDGGAGSVGRLRPALEAAGFTVVQHDYGWVGPLRLRVRNAQFVREIQDQIAPGDHLVGHSNGCLVAWELLRLGVDCNFVVAIQPALRRDTLWPVQAERILCLYNTGDWAVVAGRAWRYINPVSWFNPHQWGEAGRHGFSVPDPRVEHWDTGDGSRWLAPVRGHSAIFQRPAVDYWGAQIAYWLATQEATRNPCMSMEQSPAA